MKKMNAKSLVIGLVAAATLGLAGCASTKSFGDQVGDISRDWKQAENQVERGEKMIRDGNAQIRRGENQKSDGAAEERRAERRVAESKARYDIVAAMVGLAQDPAAADTEAKELRSIERDVKSAEDDLKDARDKQRRGENNVKDGRDKVRRGERLVAEGNADMKKIEGEYRTLAGSAG